MILAEIDVYAFVLMTNIKGISDEPSVQILFLTKTKTKTWTPKGPIYLMVSITKKKRKKKKCVITVACTYIMKCLSVLHFLSMYLF